MRRLPRQKLRSIAGVCHGDDTRGELVKLQEKDRPSAIGKNNVVYEHTTCGEQWKRQQAEKSGEADAEKDPELEQLVQQAKEESLQLMKQDPLEKAIQESLPHPQPQFQPAVSPHVKTLTEMGFAQQDCVNALAAAGNDVNLAANILLSARDYQSS